MLSTSALQAAIAFVTTVIIIVVISLIMFVVILVVTLSSFLSSGSSRQLKNKAIEKLENRQRWKQNSSSTRHDWFTKTMSLPLLSCHTLVHLPIALCPTTSEYAGIFPKPQKGPSSTQDSRASEQQVPEASCMANSAPLPRGKRKNLLSGRYRISQQKCRNCYANMELTIQTLPLPKQSANVPALCQKFAGPLGLSMRLTSLYRELQS